MLILTSRVFDGPIHFVDNNTGIEHSIDILEVKGGQVKIGFNIPDNITVLRDRVYQEQFND
tara:strand:+ start:59 stop:241 length:183 start_codon:yes stop_codon:yes gene_type:complete